MGPWCHTRWREVYETWHSCHWWRDSCDSRLTAMTTIIVFALLVLLAIASYFFGTDSRGLSDHDWESLGS